MRVAPACTPHVRGLSGERDGRLASDDGRDGPGRRWARQRIECCPNPSTARGVPRHGHRSALGTGRSGLDERPLDLCDRPKRLKVRVRRYTDVERFLLLPPPPLDHCQEKVCVGSGGVRSRMRRIFPIFHNPRVKTARFRWFRSPQGLDEHEGHGKDVHGMPVPSHTSRECGL